MTTNPEIDQNASCRIDDRLNTFVNNGNLFAAGVKDGGSKRHLYFVDSYGKSGDNFLADLESSVDEWLDSSSIKVKQEAEKAKTRLKDVHLSDEERAKYQFLAYRIYRYESLYKQCLKATLYLSCPNAGLGRSKFRFTAYWVGMQRIEVEQHAGGMAKVVGNHPNTKLPMYEPMSLYEIREAHKNNTGASEGWLTNSLGASAQACDGALCLSVDGGAIRSPRTLQVGETAPDATFAAELGRNDHGERIVVEIPHCKVEKL